MIVNRLKPVKTKECTYFLGGTNKDGERNLMVKGLTRGVIEEVCHIFQSQQPCVRGCQYGQGDDWHDALDPDNTFQLGSDFGDKPLIASLQ